MVPRGCWRVRPIVPGGTRQMIALRRGVTSGGVPPPASGSVRACRSRDRARRHRPDSGTASSTSHPRSHQHLNRDAEVAGRVADELRNDAGSSAACARLSRPGPEHADALRDLIAFFGRHERRRAVSHARRCGKKRRDTHAVGRRARARRASCASQRAAGGDPRQRTRGTLSCLASENASKRVTRVETEVLAAPTRRRCRRSP